MGASAMLKPKGQDIATSIAYTNKFGEVSTIRLENLIVLDASNGQKVVDHKLGITVRFQEAQETGVAKRRLLELLWAAERLVPEATQLEIPFLNQEITGIRMRTANLSFRLQGKEWFATGDIPIRDLNLTPALMVEWLVRVFTQVGMP